MRSDIVSISSRGRSFVVNEAVAWHKQPGTSFDDLTIDPRLVIGKMLAKDPNTPLRQLQDQAAVANRQHDECMRQFANGHEGRF